MTLVRDVNLLVPEYSFPLLLDITVRFGQAMYIVDENIGVVQILLILINPSSTNTNIKVLSADETAGKYHSIQY